MFQLRWVLVLFSVLTTAGQSLAEPVRPADDSTELVRLSQRQVEKNQTFRTSQAALAKNRNDLALAVDIARQAIEEGRRNADPRFYGQAQATLAPWWDKPDPPPEVRVLRAVIQIGRAHV